MKTAILTIVIMLVVIAQVSALTATVLTPKVIIKADSAGTYHADLGVRNDNNVTINVTVSGQDGELLLIPEPSALVEPGQEHVFNTYFEVVQPVNKSYSLTILFASPDQMVSLGAKWVLISTYAAEQPVLPNDEEPSASTQSYSRGGGGSSNSTPAKAQNATQERGNETKEPSLEPVVTDPLEVIEEASNETLSEPTVVEPEPNIIRVVGVCLMAAMIVLGFILLWKRKQNVENSH